MTRFSPLPLQSLPFEYFLKNKKSFLKNLDSQIKQTKVKDISGYESKLEELYNNESRNYSIVKSDNIDNGHGSYDSNDDMNSFNCYQPAHQSFTIKNMMAAGMHLGHTTSKWNPKMASFIYGHRSGIHIIDLEKSLICLRQACQVITDISSKNGIILFLGTREPIRRLIYECATECEQYFVNMRWLGGTITNRSIVLGDKNLLPDVILVFDIPNNMVALKEAKIANIPIIGICDTNCNPDLVTYPIPANDDAYKSVELVARTLTRAIIEGKEWNKLNKKVEEVFQSGTNFVRIVSNLQKSHSNSNFHLNSHSNSSLD